MGSTGVIDLMESVGENFKRTAKFLSSKGRMQGKEDLDHFNRTIGTFFNCTHPVRFSCSFFEKLQSMVFLKLGMDERLDVVVVG